MSTSFCVLLFCEGRGLAMGRAPILPKGITGFLVSVINLNRPEDVIREAYSSNNNSQTEYEN